MVKFKFKAYDNGWKIPMGISLSLGLSGIIAGFYGDYGDEVGWFGVICLVAFIFFKYMNYKVALKEEMEYRKQIEAKEMQDFINRMTDNNDNYL